MTTDQLFDKEVDAVIDAVIEAEQVAAIGPGAMYGFVAATEIAQRFRQNAAVTTSADGNWYGGS